MERIVSCFQLRAVLSMCIIYYIRVGSILLDTICNILAATVSTAAQNINRKSYDILRYRVVENPKRGTMIVNRRAYVSLK